MDIAGTSIVAAEGTGYGARLLVQYARNYASKWFIKARLIVLCIIKLYN